MKLIILDRDGVINQDRDDFVKSADEWVPLPGSMDAVAFLSEAGYTVAVATNQSGIGRGLFTMQELTEMHNKMHKMVQQAGGVIDGVWFCPHTAAADCGCRKPKSGMVVDILDRFNAKAENIGGTRRRTARRHAGFRRPNGVFAISDEAGRSRNGGRPCCCCVTLSTG